MHKMTLCCVEFDSHCPLMTARYWQELCMEVTKRWTVIKVAIGHRTGVVAVGEPSVIIAVSSAHRRDSLEVRWGCLPSS